MRIRSVLRHGMSSIQTLGLLLGVVGSASLVACGNKDKGVVEVKDVAQAGKALTGQLAGTVVQRVDGEYVGCFGRSGMWKEPALTYSGPTIGSSERLTVVLNDAACRLKLKSVWITTTANATMTEYALVPGASSTGVDAGKMGVGAYVAGNVGEFSNGLPGDQKLYVNSYFGDPSNFSANFKLFLVYAKDVRTLTEEIQSSFATVQVTQLSAQGIDAPDYQVNVSGVSVQVDMNGQVVAISGDIELTAPIGAQTGEEYAVVSTIQTAPPGFASMPGSDPALVDVAYTWLLASTSFITAPIVNSSSQSINISQVIATGLDLSTSVEKAIIIRHEESGIETFQVIAITLKPAVP